MSMSVIGWAAAGLQQVAAALANHIPEALAAAFSLSDTSWQVSAAEKSTQGFSVPHSGFRPSTNYIQQVQKM